MTLEQMIEACARAAHEMNKIYCEALGDTSQAHWEEAPPWQRSSAILGVQGALKGNTPEESHDSWLAVKKADGWVYGEEKDVNRKTHPCMLPYDQLPPEQQHKDKLFLQTVRAMDAALTPRLTPTKPK